MMFGSTPPETGDNRWKRQLDLFVKENKQELAALSWGLWLENQDTQGTIGINLKPTPRFVYCPKSAIEALNNNVENKLQEILGLVDAHNPEKEVLMIGIGEDQIKLIHFEPEIAPPACFEQAATDVYTLLDQLEERLSQQIETVKK